MTRKEKIRLIKVLGMTSLFLGGVVLGSYVLPKIKMEPSEIVETVKENLNKSDLGKRAFKILGTQIEEEVEEEDESRNEDENSEEEKEKEEQSFVQDLKNNIEEAVIETSSDKVINILEGLPPEEFEKLKGDFCPKFCEEASN